MRGPLLVFELALSSALLPLGDADEGVDDADNEESADDAAGDDVFSGVGEAGPLLLGFLPVGKLVQCFVHRGLAPGDLLVEMVLATGMQRLRTR